MPRVKLFNEEEVLDKAMELFWEKGYNATSIQDLVNHLGINRGSLYDTFGGKRALFLKSFQAYRDKNTKRVQDFLYQHTSVKAGFRHLFQHSIEQTMSATCNRGCFVVNTTTEFLPGDEEIKSVLAEHRKHFLKIFHDFLQTGLRSGEIAPGKDLESIASLLFTVQNGINVVGKVESDPQNLWPTIEAALAILD